MLGTSNPFSKDFLITISKTKSGVIEQLESIEQLRVIENNYPLISIPFEKTQASINEPEDLEIVLKFLKNDKDQQKIFNKILAL